MDNLYKYLKFDIEKLEDDYAYVTTSFSFRGILMDALDTGIDFEIINFGDEYLCIGLDDGTLFTTDEFDGDMDLAVSNENFIKICEAIQCM